jgi:hypothetical protein
MAGPEATSFQNYLVSKLPGSKEAFTASAGRALIGQQVELLVARLDQGQPHRFPAFDAGHFDSGLKPRTRRRRPGSWQHCVLKIQRRDATQPMGSTKLHHATDRIMSDLGQD